MSGHALESAGIYELGEINQKRMDLPEKNRKKIYPANVKGVIIRVTRKAYPYIAAEIQPILAALGHEGHWTTGSAGSWNPKHPWFKLGSVKETAGDIDVHVNAEAIRQKLELPKGADESAIRAGLASHLQQHFQAVTQTGEQVHIAYPAKTTVSVPVLGVEVPAYYQVDFPTTFNADTTYKHHEHDYSQDFKWDGQDQQMAMSSLINSLPGHPEKTHLYYGMGGALKSRANGEVLERDIHKLAQRLFNDTNANQDWLATADRILQHIPQGIDNPRLAQFKGDMQKKYPDRFLKEGSVDWFKAIRQIVSI